MNGIIPTSWVQIQKFKMAFDECTRILASQFSSINHRISKAFKRAAKSIFETVLSATYYAFGIQSGKNVFTSSFFANFKTLISDTILINAQSYSENLVAASHALIQAQNFDEIKQTYQSFTKILREEIEQNPNPTLQEFVYRLYTQDLSSNYDDLIQTELNVSQIWDRLHQNNPVSVLKKLRFKMSQSLSFIGYPHEQLYDPRMEGDLPSKAYELNFDGHTTTVIRTPNVTQDVQNYGPVESYVVPEFKSFLNQGHKHLYINLMITQADCGEKRRSSSIHDLETTYPNLTVISLDKDSHFYHQKGNVFFSLNDAHRFKQIFVENMQKKLNFQFPEDFDIESVVPKVLDRVHETYFDSKPTLERHERREFIELAYSAFIHQLCEELKPDVLNISCKSSVDRGAAQLAMLHAFHHQNKTTLDKKLITRLAFGPALAYQNRKMLKDRFIMLNGALKHLV